MYYEVMDIDEVINNQIIILPPNLVVDRQSLENFIS